VQFYPFNQVLTIDSVEVRREERVLLISCKGTTYNALYLRSQGINELYFSKGQCNADMEMERIFKFLCSKETDSVRARTLRIQGRDVTLEKTCGQVAFCSFEELCDRVRMKKMSTVDNVDNIDCGCGFYFSQWGQRTI
jgi:hypothetical protein